MKMYSRKLMVTIGVIIGVPLADLPENSYWVAIVYIIAQGAIDFIGNYVEHRKGMYEND